MYTIGFDIPLEGACALGFGDRAGLRVTLWVWGAWMQTSASVGRSPLEILSTKLAARVLFENPELVLRSEPLSEHCVFQNTLSKCRTPIPKP